MKYSASKLRGYFQRYNIEKSTRGWWIFDCPVCDCGRHKKKCAVNFVYQYVKCWECGLRAWADVFIQEIEGVDRFGAATLISNSPELFVPKYSIRSKEIVGIQLPSGIKLAGEEGELQDRFLNYMKHRGFELDFLEEHSVGYCEVPGKYFGYMIIPFLHKGECIYFIARDFLGRQGVPKYLNPGEDEVPHGRGLLLYNQEALYRFDRVYHLEGVLDAWTVGDNAVASLGWAVTTDQLYLISKSTVKEYIIVPDPGYESEAWELAYKVSRYKEVLVKETGAGDVNKIGKSAFELLQTHKFSFKRWLEMTTKTGWV